MNTSEIISGLDDLKKDAESHREADGTMDDVFQHDIDVLDAAVKFIEALQMPYTTLEKCWYNTIPANKECENTLKCSLYAANVTMFGTHRRMLLVTVQTADGR